MEFSKFVLASCSCLLLFACQEKTAGEEEKPEIIIQEQSKELAPVRRKSIESYAPVIEKVAPAVVNIYAFLRNDTQLPSSPFMDDPFFKQFYDHLNRKGGEEQLSLGSGVIVSKDGYILTNYHVVDDADIVRVSLSDRREFKAKVIVADKRTDLALLKIKAKEDFPYLKVQTQDNLEVGDVVLAIGNPFGVGQTVTSGIVSALSRSHEGISDVRTFIQTDAAINPGNSGGPLITTDGRLVGINTAIFSKTGGSMGIGFAIPIGLAVPVIESLSHGGHIVRPWMGFAIQSVSFEDAQVLGLSHPYGVLVKKVYPGSSADKAGIKVGDFIADFNGLKIKDGAALDYWIATSPIGKKVDLTVIRKGKEKVVSVILNEPVREKDSKPLIIEGRNPLQGVSLRTLSPALALELGNNPMEEGVVITKISSSSLASQLGIQPGDILQSINGEKIKTKEKVAEILKKPVPFWALVLKRGKQILRLQVRS